MKSLEEAIACILSSISPTETETIPLAAALGRFLAHPAASGTDLPIFDNSAMDGYAVRSADTSGASPQDHRSLKVIGTVPAGRFFSGCLEAGQCVRIFTGSPMPNGADAVIMQEDVRGGGAAGSFVECLDSVKPWENIRFKGEEIKAGQTLAGAGSRISPQRIGLLASAGVAEVTTHRSPKCSLLVTGAELRKPGSILAPGEIYESNGLMLGAALAELGIQVENARIVADDHESTRQAVVGALSDSDVVIASGGASVGDFDFVKPAFLAAGGTIDFWRVAIKPGKPFLFGTLEGKYFFGLPGNPVSSFVTFMLLVRPALLRLMGAASSLPRRVQVRLAEPVFNRGDRRHFMRARFNADGLALLSGMQASHGISALGAAEMLLDLPPETRFEPGAEVSAILI